MKYFRSRNNKFRLPIFFPDATRAVIKTLDSVDIKNSKTQGVLVNTFHLYRELGKDVLKKHKGIRNFMNWDGGVISDSGGFQVMSVIKRNPGKGKIIDKGVLISLSKSKSTVFTPEMSMSYQMLLGTDMVVVLDDFTPPGASYKQAKKTVERTIGWAERSKKRYLEICAKKNLSNDGRPYILAVVQGGDHLNLRKECALRLAEIGFDGFGYGGWPIDESGKFNYEVAEVIAKYTPKNYFLYGLGIGKPEDIVGCVERGYNIFDCVLPTRDARHSRLYVYKADSIENINIKKPNFYEYYVPGKKRSNVSKSYISKACDCLLCTNYSKDYLDHLFNISDSTAMRLATIHNLRFYSILMEKLRQK